MKSTFEKMGQSSPLTVAGIYYPDLVSNLKKETLVERIRYQG